MADKVSCLIVRGGSSKGVFFERAQLPPPGPDRDRVILNIYGSPDKRQIDGLGGADKLTSKTAVMGPPTREDCDIDYLFGQVMIDSPDVEWESMCGNISAGAALYAVHKGYVSAGEGPAVQVRSAGALIRLGPEIQDMLGVIQELGTQVNGLGQLHAGQGRDQTLLQGKEIRSGQFQFRPLTGLAQTALGQACEVQALILGQPPSAQHVTDMGLINGPETHGLRTRLDRGQ